MLLLSPNKIGCENQSGLEFIFIDKNFPKNVNFRRGLRPRLFPPKSGFEQNIKSKLSFHAYILENFSKFLN